MKACAKHGDNCPCYLAGYTDGSHQGYQAALDAHDVDDSDDSDELIRAAVIFRQMERIVRFIREMPDNGCGCASRRKKVAVNDKDLFRADEVCTICAPFVEMYHRSRTKRDLMLDARLMGMGAQPEGQASQHIARIMDERKRMKRLDREYK